MYSGISVRNMLITLSHAGNRGTGLVLREILSATGEWMLVCHVMSMPANDHAAFAAVLLVTGCQVLALEGTLAAANAEGSGCAVIVPTTGCSTCWLRTCSM